RPGSTSMHLAAEQVAASPYRLQALDGVVKACQLATHMTDMHVQAAVMLRIAALQDLLVEEGLAQDLVGMCQQHLQNTVLTGRQTRPLPLVAHIATLFVETQAGVLA